MLFLEAFTGKVDPLIAEVVKLISAVGHFEKYRGVICQIAEILFMVNQRCKTPVLHVTQIHDSRSYTVEAAVSGENRHTRFKYPCE